MKQRSTVNAMRSAVVVLGAMAFGYLTLQLGFKPYLERAQLAADQSESEVSSSSELLQQEQEQPQLKLKPPFLNGPARRMDRY